VGGVISLTICPGRLQTMTLLISTSQVTRITGVSLAYPCCLLKAIPHTPQEVPLCGKALEPWSWLQILFPMTYWLCDHGQVTSPL
jgi:hypothetical protein